MPIRLDPCQPGYVRSTVTGKCEPITITPPPPPPPPPPGPTQPPTPPPGVIQPFDPSAAMLAAYRRMFGTGAVNLGRSDATGGGTPTSPLVSTTGVGTPTPGTGTARSPVPLPGFQNVTFTPGQPQFFGNVPGAMLPGTLPSNYNPISNYKGPLATDVLAQNPNLSPTILGGLQGLGYYTDRLGNRIFAPGGAFANPRPEVPTTPPPKSINPDDFFNIRNPVRAFADGGEADKDEASATSAQAELRALLDAMPAETETEVSVSPTSRTVRKTKKKAVDTGKAKGISMSLEESMASIEPPSRASARDQLAALLRRNRGLVAKTFSTPTLDRASLAARGPLATKRFEEGGEAKSTAREQLDKLAEYAGRGARSVKRGAAELLGVADIPRRAERESVAAFGVKESGGGKADAMRHLMYQADLARKFNPTTANVVSRLYELTSPGQSSAEYEMDLYNDALGRQIGERAKSDEDVVRLAREYVEKNKAKILPKEQRTGYAKGGDVKRKGR